MDKRTSALLGILCSSLDVLGALYLAYDLLGGEHGPLRTLTRFVTYGALFGIGFGLVLGPVFGLAAGGTHGLTLAWELSRASRHEKAGYWFETAMSAIRGVGYALAAWYSHGLAFGLTFGVFSIVGQAVAYRFGVSPAADYRPATRPRLTRLQLVAAANRTVGYGVTGYVSSLVARQPDHALAVGLRTGVAIGLVTALFGTCTPFVEWFAENVPAKRLGVFGIILILIGFTLQSAQYWAALLE